MITMQPSWILKSMLKADQFKTKTYDKRENYKFGIVNYPDLSGNFHMEPHMVFIHHK